MKKCAIIVDPLSSGKYLPEEFASRGIECIAVLSNPVPAVVACSYVPSNFKEIINFDGDVDSLAKRLALHSPICVMVGIETGLDLMDKLAAKLGLSGNDPATSMMRRDKYQMHATLKKEGIRSIKQRRVASELEATEWIMAHGIWPVIVKPSNSAASDNVWICKTLEEAQYAVGEIISSKNVFGEMNDCALVQEYLDGREWVVDTVSCNGRHVVTNITRYLKVVTEDGRIVYRHSEFMAPTNPDFSELISYALSVNNALGVNYGSAHIEIIMTKAGPTLVELNGRMHGCDAINALRWCYDVTQLDLSVDSYIDPVAFAEKSERVIEKEKYMIAHHLISTAAGKVVSVVDTETLKNIKSYKSHCLPSIGKIIKKTESLSTSPGSIWLINDDENYLMSDQQILIRLEQEGKLYALTPA